MPEVSLVNSKVIAGAADSMMKSIIASAVSTGAKASGGDLEGSRVRFLIAAISPARPLNEPDVGGST